MVKCGCGVLVMVCGWPGMFVVVEVKCGQHGGRWLWDEEGSHVAICDACDFWIMNVHAHSRSCLHPNLHSLGRVKTSFLLGILHDNDGHHCHPPSVCVASLQCC